MLPLAVVPMQSTLGSPSSSSRGLPRSPPRRAAPPPPAAAGEGDLAWREEAQRDEARPSAEAVAEGSFTAEAF